MEAEATEAEAGYRRAALNWKKIAGGGRDGGRRREERESGFITIIECRTCSSQNRRESQLLTNLISSLPFIYALFIISIN